MSEFADIILSAVAGLVANDAGWIRTNCPLCILTQGSEDKRFSFGLSATSGRFECYRCGERGRLSQSDLDLADVQQRTVVVTPPTDEPIELPDEYLPLWCGDGETAWSTEEAREYLAGRGIGPGLIEAARIGACVTGRYQSRVVIPVLIEDVCRGWVARAHWDADRAYLYPMGMRRGSLLYNQAALYVETDTPCLVVEGIFDVFPYYPDAVACLGKPTAGQIAIMLGAKRPLVTVLDGDAWREGRALAQRLRFEGLRAASLRLPPRRDPATVLPSSLMQQAMDAVT